MWGSRRIARSFLGLLLAEKSPDDNRGSRIGNGSFLEWTSALIHTTVMTHVSTFLCHVCWYWCLLQPYWLNWTNSNHTYHKEVQTLKIRKYILEITWKQKYLMGNIGKLVKQLSTENRTTYMYVWITKKKTHAEIYTVRVNTHTHTHTHTHTYIYIYIIYIYQLLRSGRIWHKVNF